jgi:thiol-disulfide isomerase/thioredoxin
MRPLSLAAALAAVLAAAPGTGARQPDKKVDPKTKADPKTKTEPDGAEPPFNMKVTTSDIKLGTQLAGAALTADDLKGKVVVVDFWGVNCAPCLAAMPGTAALNAELSDFGLVVIGSHVQDATPGRIRSVAASRGANFPITDQTRVNGGNDFQGIPHVMVFDHTGACVYRGSPKEAEVKARLAVGESLVAGAGREKFHSQLTPVVSDLKKGLSPRAALPRVVALQNSANPMAAADAKALLASLTAPGQKKLELAQEKIETDPVGAFVLVEKVPATYAGTPVAKEATALITKLKKDKAVKTELAARPSIETVRQIESQLAAKPDADKASAPEFQKANAALLTQLRTTVTQMKKNWPDAKATSEAVGIVEKYAPEAP